MKKKTWEDEYKSKSNTETHTEDDEEMNCQNNNPNSPTYDRLKARLQKSKDIITLEFQRVQTVLATLEKYHCKKVILLLVMLQLSCNQMYYKQSNIQVTVYRFIICSTLNNQANVNTYVFVHMYLH